MVRSSLSQTALFSPYFGTVQAVILDLVRQAEDREELQLTRCSLSLFDSQCSPLGAIMSVSIAHSSRISYTVRDMISFPSPLKCMTRLILSRTFPPENPRTLRIDCILNVVQLEICLRNRIVRFEGLLQQSFQNLFLVWGKVRPIVAQTFFFLIGGDFHLGSLMLRTNVRRVYAIFERIIDESSSS